MGFTSVVAIGALLILWIQYYFVLWSSQELLDASDIEDLLQTGNFEMTEKAYLTLRTLRYGRYLTTSGPPPPRPEAQYKLKILLTFIQILLNLSLSLEIDYPQRFVTFINYFNPLNLDFVKLTSADCISSAIDHYFKFYCWLLLPVGMILILYVAYLLPNQCNRNATGAQKKRRRREFWRLVMFTLFLVYPSVSSSIFSIFVCKDVEGTSYLTADFSLLCYTEKWKTVSYVAFAAIVIYPIGVPFFFLWQLRSYRYGKAPVAYGQAKINRLPEKGIRAQLGFLYDCYDGRVWWFEALDMVHKLTATSLIAFFPWEAQIACGMGVLLIYLMTLLVINPYIRKGDDRLRLVAQMELLMLLLAGNCIEKGVVLDNTMDWLLTFVLTIMVVAFMTWWVSSISTVIRKMLSTSDGACAIKCRVCCRIKKKGEASKKQQTNRGNAILGPMYLADREQITSHHMRVQLIAGTAKFTFAASEQIVKSANSSNSSAAHTRSKSDAELTKLTNVFGEND